MPGLDPPTALGGAAEPRIVGRYALHRAVAWGGSATVHLGRFMGAAGFARTVAIKRLHPAVSRDPEFVTMFMDEARLVARIHHPNVVPVLDVVAEDGELLLVMEYVHGEVLSALLRGCVADKVPVPTAITCAVAVDFLSGLHAAHEAKNKRGEPLGIVHRDVSPQNVIVGVDGTARVLDFGVAKAKDRLRSTADGSVRGKLAYMAPEQINGERLDRRTDVYAAAVVIWELLAGRRLFAGKDRVTEIGRAIEGKLPRPSETGAEVPPELEAIVMKGLSAERAARYETARDMAVAIGRAHVAAMPAEIGEWVTRRAKDGLAVREAYLEELDLVLPGDPASMARLLASVAPREKSRRSRERERARAKPSAPPPALSSAAPIVLEQTTDANATAPRAKLTATRPSRLRARARVGAWLGVAVVAGFVAGVALLSGKRGQTEQAASPPAAAQPTFAGSALPAATNDAPGPSAPTPVNGGVTVPDGPQATAQAAPSASAPTRATPANRARSASASGSASPPAAELFGGRY